MVLLGVMSVPVFFLNVQNQFNILSLVNGTANHYGFSTEQIQLQVMLYINQL